MERKCTILVLFLFTRMMFFTNTRYMMLLTCYRQKTVRAMMKKKD